MDLERLPHLDAISFVTTVASAKPNLPKPMLLVFGDPAWQNNGLDHTGMAIVYFVDKPVFSLVGQPPLERKQLFQWVVFQWFNLRATAVLSGYKARRARARLRMCIAQVDGHLNLTLGFLEFRVYIQLSAMGGLQCRGVF